jgi:hypothetical protein
LLGFAPKEIVKVMQAQHEVKNLTHRLESAEKEIAMLKSVGKDELSPIPQIRMPDEELSIHFTPVSRGYIKSRNSSVDTGLNRSVETSIKPRTRRAGAAIGNLVAKLQSVRKIARHF